MITIHKHKGIINPLFHTHLPPPVSTSRFPVGVFLCTPPLFPACILSPVAPLFLFLSLSLYPPPLPSLCDIVSVFVCKCVHVFCLYLYLSYSVSLSVSFSCSLSYSVSVSRHFLCTICVLHFVCLPSLLSLFSGFPLPSLSLFL